MDQKYWNIGEPSIQLMEECSEVIQILCKAKRFGWDNYHPNDPEQTPNTELVLREIDDLEMRIREFRKWMRGDYPPTSHLTGQQKDAAC